MIDLDDMSPTKPKGDKPMEKVVSFYLDDELSENLEMAKFYLRKSKGEIIREALERYLENQFPEDVREKIKNLIKGEK